MFGNRPATERGENNSHTLMSEEHEHVVFYLAYFTLLLSSDQMVMETSANNIKLNTILLYYMHVR